MNFVHPAILLFLWLIPAAAWLAAFRDRRRAKRVAMLVGEAQANAARRPARAAAQRACLYTGLALAVVATARPTWGEREVQSVSSARNVLIALDVSRSMLAEDVRPNRLDRAKADLIDLVSDLQGDLAGLLVFRNSSTMLCPFTTDTSFLLHALEGVSIDSAKRGETDLGRALEDSLAAFEKLGGEHNAIILLSDGEDLSGKAVETARKCAEAGIPVFCVGVGGVKGADVPSDETGKPLVYKGETVVSRLDNKTLSEIASVSGGAYIPLASTASGANTLGSIYRKHVRTAVEREKLMTSEMRRIERYRVFLFPAFALLVAAACLSNGRPHRRKTETKRLKP